MTAFFKGFNAPQADYMRGIFDSFLLPLPEDGEYTSTHDLGVMAMVTPAACVLRISKKKHISIFNDEAWAHDHILQPLHRREGEGLVVDIYPGIHTPAMQTVDTYLTGEWQDQVWDAEKGFIRDLRRDGYVFILSIHPFNLGVLPGTESEAWPEGFPVFLDPGDIHLPPPDSGAADEACRRLRESTHAVRALLERSAAGEAIDFSGSALPVQGPHYADLRRGFARAAASGRPGDMEAAWRACVEAKARGRLVAEWGSTVYVKPYCPYERIEKMPERTAAYDRRLARAPLFAGPG